MKKDHFSATVIQKLDYYVYRLVDPRNGVTFYVGKGKGNRIFDHVKKRLEKDEDEISAKIKTINEIEGAGLKPVFIIHRHGMDSATALEVEAALIDAYPGVTNIIGGIGGDYGVANAEEIINRYEAETADFGNDKVILISINKSFPDQSLYDATRLAWRIDLNRANKADFVLAVQNGVIKGVFIATWKRATKANFPTLINDIKGRCGFDGCFASENINERYLNKRIPDAERSKGARNPIRYFNGA
jgi:uncharacterized protein